MVLLLRQFDTPFGMFGRLITDELMLWCLEPPWKGNAKNESCIPEGRYPLEQGEFQNRYENLSVLSVPGREFIEFHRGNTLRDTEGCILPGRSLGVIGQSWAVIDSGSALADLVDAVADRSSNADPFLYVFDPAKCQAQSPSY